MYRAVPLGPRVLSLRLGAAICAVPLGLIGLWIVAAELVRPSLGDFPRDIDAAERWSAASTSLTASASIGTVRGDLWTMAAIGKAAPFLFQVDGKQAVALDGATDALKLAEQAAALAPHDARAWLVIACLGTMLHGNSQQARSALKVSYYVGPQQASLLPVRLPLSLRPEMISDQDVSELTSLDLQGTFRKRPELKPVVAAAYRSASPQGRAFLETQLKSLDPGFLERLRS